MSNNKSIAFQAKMKLQRLVLSQPHLSMRAKVAFTVLIDCFNCETGRCNPTRETLMAALGVKVDTIKRALAELEQAKWISRKFTRGAPYYSLAFDRHVDNSADGGAHAAPASRADGGADQPGWGARLLGWGRIRCSTE